MLDGWDFLRFSENSMVLDSYAIQRYVQVDGLRKVEFVITGR